MPNLTFEVQCPDVDCAEEFDLEIPAGHDMTEGGIVECPECQTEWDWIQDDQGEIILFDDDEDLEAEETDDGTAAVIETEVEDPDEE